MSKTKKPAGRDGSQDDRHVFGTQMPDFSGQGPRPESVPTGTMVAGGSPVAGTDRATAVKGTLFAPPVSRSPLASMALGEPVHARSTAGLKLISQTHRADSSQLKMLSAAASGAVTADSQTDKVDRGGKGRAARDDGHPRVKGEGSQAGHIITPAARRVRDAGKSTWNLKIHQRDITGHMSGVAGAAPTTEETDGSTPPTGLRAAFARGEASPEYEVLGELGAGSMGIVYRARQTSLNRELAIKTLKPASTYTEHDQEMFVSEAVVTANLVHPNIIPIHDLGHTPDGKLFYSMKQVTGVSWDKVLPVRPQEENLDIFMKLCDAVAYAHSRGVINRDLKPENVVVGNYGEVVVLDWGLAIAMDRFEKRNSVNVDFRGCAGTPVYMSPELADEDISLMGPHSDIYLLGGILFEILEGFPPHFLRRLWHVNNPTEQLNGVIEAVLTNEIEQDVTNRGELMQIARKAMATQPEDRYHTVEALQEAIREYRITGRAEELLRSSQESGRTSYQDYQSAVALYGEALRKWPNNRRAFNGDRDARLAYAKLALSKGDIDLGLQVTADRDEQEFTAIRSRLRKSSLQRKVIRGTWGVMSVTATALLLVVVWLYADLIDKNGTVEQLAQREESLQGSLQEKEAEVQEAEAKVRLADERVAEADSKVMEAAEKEQEANDRVREADEKLVLLRDSLEAANEAILLAQKEKNEIDLLLKDVREEAEIQRKAAVLEKENAETARMQAIAARRESFVAQLEGFEIRIKAYEELGEYGRVIEVAEEALRQADKNEVIDANKKAVFEQQIRAFRQRVDQSEIRLDEKPAAAAVSADGTTVVAWSRGARPGVRVVRDQPSAGSLADCTRHYLPASRGLAQHVTTSGDGSWVCLVGKNIKQLWQWQEDEYREVPMPQNFPKSRTASGSDTFIKALFSADGRHLYLLGADDRATVEVYALYPGAAEALTAGSPLSLSGDSSGGFAVRDAVLMPDESALIAQTAEFGCFAFPLVWTNGKPAFAETHVRAPRLAGLDDRRISSAIYDPRQLVLSPDASRLALISGRSVLILRRSDQASRSQFPFDSPADAPLQYFQTSFPVTNLAISGDGQRIAAGDNKRYIQVWEMQDGTYQPSAAAGLYAHRNNAARSLRGHSEGILALWFRQGSADQLVSVAADSRVRTWTLSTYGDYVAKFETLRGLLTPENQDQEQTLRQPVSARPMTAEVSRTAEQRFHRLSVGDPVFVSTHPFNPATDTGSQTEDNAAVPLRTGRRIFSARFSQDGRRVLLGTDDLAAHVFDSRTGQPVMQGSAEGRKELFFDPERNNFLEGHISEISSIRFLPPTGDLLLSADYFGSISVWDAVPDEDGIAYEKTRLLSEYSFSEFSTSDDGQWILAGGAITDETAPLEDAGLNHLGVLWRTSDMQNGPTARPYRTLEGQHPRFAITAVALSPSGQLAMTAGRRGRIVIWKVDDGSVVAVAAESHGRDQVSGGFFLSESQLITAGYDGRVFQWDIGDGVLKSTELTRGPSAILPEFIIRLRPDPDRTQFITSEVLTLSEGAQRRRLLNLSIWSGDTVRPLLSKPVEISDQDKGKAFRHDISWSSDGQELLLVVDGEITIYRTSDWTIQRRFRQDAGGVKAVRGSLAPAAPGRPPRVATFDGRFTHLWDLQTGERLAEFRSHSIANVAADFSPDTRHVVTGSESIRVFDAAEGSPNHGRTLFRFPVREAHPSIVSDVRFCPQPDLSLLASIDRLGGLKIWEWHPAGATPLTEISSVPPQSEDPSEWAEGYAVTNALSWSDDGIWLAAIQSGHLRMWRIQERQLQPVEPPLPPGISLRLNQLDFSGTHLLTAGGVAFVEETGEIISYGLIWQTGDDGQIRLLAAINDAHPVDPQSASGLTGITAVAFDDTRQEILTGGSDGELIRWQIGTLSADRFRPLDRIARISLRNDVEAPHEWPITAIDVAADGRIISADINGNAILWPPDLQQ